MENKNGKLLKILFIFILLCLIAGIVYYLINKEDNTTPKIEKNTEKENNQIISLTDYKLPDIKEESMKKEFKVLIIELDPLLTKGTIAGVSCKGKYASECLSQNKNKAVNELISDLNNSSNNNLSVKIVKTEQVNEFPTYKNKVTLQNGGTDYKFDEDTWLDIMKDGWYKGISDSRVAEIGDWFGSFDYEYIINKLNLVERRNNNEFDEVWIVNVDPAGTYESIMVGNNAFWINGTPIEKKCAPFKMINVSISRPDANFECFGHATEQLLSNVFKNTNWNGYDPLNWKNNSTTISNNEYEKLNLFQKFMLTENQNTNKNTGYAGVGNMHYAPNSTKDYDWNNQNNIIYSKSNEWSNYPNITNKPSLDTFSPSVYMNKEISGTYSEGRYHHIWWFSLLPHHNSYTKDGYYNNWWNYYANNTYVVEITSSQSEYNYHINDKIDNITFILKNRDNSIESVSLKYDNNVIISDMNLFKIDNDGNLYASKSGTSDIKFFRDGISVNVKITIE